MKFLTFLDGCLADLAEASELEPDTACMKKYGAFVTLLVSKRQDSAGGGEGSSDLVKKLSGLWCEVADQGQALVTANRRAVNVCNGDISAHLKTDGLKLVRAVISLRKALLKSVQGIEKVSESAPAAFAEHPGLVDFIGWQLPEQFQTELNCQAVDDILAVQCGLTGNKMADIDMRFDTGLNEHYSSKNLAAEDHFTKLCSGSTSWKKDLGEDASVDDVMSAAQVLTKNLPVKLLKDYASQAEKARGA